MLGISLSNRESCVLCSMDLLKNLTEENSRLIRDNKRANERWEVSFAHGMLCDIASEDLQGGILLLHGLTPLLAYMRSSL